MVTRIVNDLIGIHSNSYLPQIMATNIVEKSSQNNEGDLYCRVIVETPVNLTAEQRKLLEQFEATFKTDKAQRRHSPKSATFLDSVKSF